MNKVILMGRLTRDPEVRYSGNGADQMAVARFTLAVDRRKANADGTRAADFIGCVAFRKTAEFCERYLKQGTKVAVAGAIQTGSYTGKDGNKVYTTDVIVDDVEFAESKQAQAPAQTQEPANLPEPELNAGFLNIPEGLEEDGLPFN